MQHLSHLPRLFLLTAVLVLILFPVALFTSCRANSTTTTNHITLGTVAGGVYMANFEFGRGNNDATQAADKKVGDIAPKASVAAGPASKVAEAAGIGNAMSEQPPPVPSPIPVIGQ